MTLGKQKMCCFRYNMIWTRYILIALLFLLGCDKLQPSDNPVVFSLDTKAIVGVKDQETFRIMLYNEQDRSFVQTGAYYKKAGESALVACQLADDGTFMAF